MGLYTGTGDAGETRLGDGRRVRKDDPRVIAYGDVDELNALLGLCGEAEAFRERIRIIQSELFAIGAELSCSNASKNPEPAQAVSEASYRRLEAWIDEASQEAGPIQAFILPGGCLAACRFHHARTVCRRAERSIVALDRHEPVRADVLVYLNRLSDLLFAWARLANRRAGLEDVNWDSGRDH
jgi:cob(I)alamin adenosyltransferase